MKEIQKHKPTVMQLISEGSTRTDLLRHFAQLTVGDVVGAGYPALSALRKQYTREKIENVVASLLIDAGSAFEKSLSKENALELSIEINVAFYYLTLEDIFCAMQSFKKKPLYGALTQQKMLSHIQSYADERITIAEQRSINKHLAQKDNRLNYDDPNAGVKQIKEDEGLAQFKDAYMKIHNHIKPVDRKKG